VSTGRPSVTIPASNVGDNKKMQTSAKTVAKPLIRISTAIKKGNKHPFFGSSLATQFYYDKLRVPDRQEPHNCVPIILEAFVEYLSQEEGLMEFYLSY
jgi:hypothetical protein